MGYNLFLDDNWKPNEIANLTSIEKNRIRYRTYHWIIVNSYDEFVNYILVNGIPDIISFDHDLSPEHYEITDDYDKYIVKTGYHAAEWILEYLSNNNLSTPIFLVHSQNAIGRKNIENLLF